VLRLHGVVAAAALIAASLAALATGGCDSRQRKATPLSGFSAPFVFGHFQVPPDNPLTKESVELGRRLFYEKRLSATGQVSCSTCHIQSLAFTDGRVKSVGVSGKPRAFNSMSLANLMWGPQHFFWNGRAATLEEQALIPIQHPDEMAQDLGRLVAALSTDAGYREMFETAYGEVSAAAIARALASFERTLISSNSRYDQFLRGEITLNPQEELGRKLFMAHPDVKVSLRGANCIDCHSQFGTGGFSARHDGFSNNGLDDEEHLQHGLQAVTGNPAHRGLFKVPSLRNIELTAPYMHDGRLKTLEEVLDHYDSGIRNSSTLSPLIVEADNRGAAAEGRIGLHLTATEKAAILAFLRTLTDQDFVSAERFSDPFARK
jgi:cytochrome c peroxidase